jgi:hypothetical protein
MYILKDLGTTGFLIQHTSHPKYRNSKCIYASAFACGTGQLVRFRALT